MPNSKDPSKAGRGRPPRPEGEQPVRQQLIDAARRCLAEKSARSVSIRELAEAADTTSAMVRYYFGSKAGLFAALIDQFAHQHLSNASLDLSLLPPQDRDPLVIGHLMRLHKDNPWVARLIVDEVLNSESSLRERFAEGAGASGSAVMKNYIRLQIEAGYFRSDLDVDRAAVSLLSLLAFPFLAAPALKLTHQFELDDDNFEQWVSHTCTLFVGACR